MALVKLEPKDYITDVPRFPDFPEAEYRRRIDRAKQLMNENKIDCLVVWKREDITYFFGLQTTRWEILSMQPGVGIIPVDGEPVLVVPELLYINAQVFGWIRNIRIQPRAHEVPKERALPKEVAGVVKEIGCGKKVIALESGPLGCIWIPRPLNDIEAFRNELPGAKFVDGDKVIWGCRMIKSSLEVESGDFHGGDTSIRDRMLNKRHGGEGVFGFEDQYVVTDKGYERIEGLDKRIIQVAHPIC